MNLKLAEHWPPRLISFVLCALTAACAVFWVLKMSNSSATVKTATPPQAPNVINTAKLAQLLGERTSDYAPSLAASTTQTSSTFKLLGVIAQGQDHGRALIATGDKPAKPYRVGELVAPDMMLLSVHSRSVELGATDNTATNLTLKLPVPPTAR
ncbi:type II secretion system protein N [Rhodoferax sp.]|uniref:type II secretion system protein N n=1 Tax=Rhodoferax sp. TaxID=50421 RepID=UPI00260CB02D|nr:type II secretion system protein N [Rhodoferax sp.]MDD2811410.1 type II secretion system protein N [Rhodoferax sp.]MDD5480465.1 type II secretion system protein N [Rhodoferax sp.]